jgi:hypothetical protein
MEIAPHQSDQDLTEVAEAFARSIHDLWGVGMESECGGSGAVVFLSVQDRAVFISRGRAMERFLTNSRLDSILDDMKPLLRRQEYGSAIVVGLQEIQRYVKMGEPGFWEELQEYSWVLVVVTVVGIVHWNARRDQARRRQFAEMTKQLSELDRARAEALQGRYQVTSCPICLECFPGAPIDESETVYISKASGPIDSARMEVRLGCDGKPIKLLRCGHCFDDTCFAEWIRTGNGQVDKCPICKAPIRAEGGDIGVRRNGEGTDGVQEAPLRSRGATGGADSSCTDTIGPGGPNSTSYRTYPAASIRMRFDPVAALRNYNEERIFRLARLQRRYPQVVNCQG